MMNNKMLLMADSGAGDGNLPSEIYEDYAARSLRIDTGSGGELVSLTIPGVYEPNPRASTPAIGYTDKDGETTFEVRVTGDRFLDGNEFVRLMKRIDSPAYGGEYDDEHFLYICSDTSNYTVVSSNHFSTPTTANTFKMTATLTEDINSGGAIVPGLHFKYTSGTTSAIRAAKSEIGDVVISGTSYSGNAFGGLIHKATSKYMELPIRYDSVSFFTGSNAPSVPYWCHSVAFKIGSPLMSTSAGEVWDELECISGVLTRRVGVEIIDDSYEITDAVYCGIPCHRIALKNKVGEAMVDIGGYWESDIDYFSEFGECLVLPPKRDCVYIRFTDDTDLESAIEYIRGATLVYQLTEPIVIQLNERLDPELKTGANIICLGTDHIADIYATYTVKE